MRRRLAQSAHGLLRRANLDIRRIGAGPRRTLAEVAAQLGRVGVEPASVIDVGIGWQGTPDLYAAFPGAHLLLIDPLAEWEPVMRGIAARRPAHVAVAAAGPSPGERELSVHRVLDCSSMIGARGGDDGERELRVVPVVRVDDLVTEHRLQPRFVIKVDVEGGELEVLAGAQRTLERADAVLLEVSLFSLVPGAPQFADVVGWMRENGWVVYDVYGGHLRPLDGALAQLDLAFVRDDGRLRADHRYAAAAQADRLYESWGN